MSLGPLEYKYRVVCEYIEFVRESIWRMGKAKRQKQPSILATQSRFNRKKHQPTIKNLNPEFDLFASPTVDREIRSAQREENARNNKVTLGLVDLSDEESRCVSKYTEATIKPPSPSDDIFQAPRENTSNRCTLGLGRVDKILPGKHASVNTYASLVMAATVPGGASRIASLVFDDNNTWMGTSLETQQIVVSLMADCEDAHLPDIVNELTKNMHNMSELLKPGVSIRSVLSAFERNSCTPEEIDNDGCFGVPWVAGVNGEAAEAQPVVHTNYQYAVRTQWQNEWHKNHPTAPRLECVSIVVDTTQHGVLPQPTV